MVCFFKEKILDLETCLNHGLPCGTTSDYHLAIKCGSHQISTCISKAYDRDEHNIIERKIDPNLIKIWTCP